MSSVSLHGTYGYTLSGYTRASDSAASPSPAVEIGYIHFEPNGTASGASRLSTGDSADEDTITRFEGQYALSPQTAGGGKVIPLGVITVHATSEPELSWDYSFMVIDDMEIMLTSRGKTRAGVLSGTMKRIHAQILTPGGTGSRK
jgi:hypothetical protein